MKYEDIKNKKYRVPKDYFEKNYKKFSDNYSGYYLEYGGKIHTNGEDGKLGAFEKLYIRGELDLQDKTKVAQDKLKASSSQK